MRIPLVDGEIDLVRRVVLRAGRTAILTSTEATLIELLVAHAGRDVPREALEAHGFTSSRAVDRAVYGLRPKIESDAAEPVHLVTVYLVGYRWVPGVRQRTAPRTNLGLARTPLVGRADLVDRIERLLPGRVCLVGPAGVGKSRLAEEVGRRAAASGAAVWRVEVGACGSTAEVVLALVRILGLDPSGSVGAALRAAAAVLAAAGPTVLVLDDVDLLADAVDTLTATLETSVLCTSRAPIRGAPVVTVSPLPEDDAVRLFLDRVADVGGPVAIDRAAVARIAQLTDGLPLALELAASRVRSLPVAAIADALDRHQLRILRRPGADRHASMEATLAWSWDQLDPRLRTALGEAALFPATFSARLADAVVSGGATAVRELVRLGFGWELAEPGKRFRLPSAVRELALARAESGAEASRRFVDAWVAFVTEGMSVRPVSGAILASFLEEYPNLQAALALAGERIEALAVLTVATSQVVDVPADVSRALADRLPPGELQIRLRLIELWEETRLDRWARAEAIAREVIDLAEADGSVSLVVDALGALVACHASRGDPDGAEALAVRAVALARDEPGPRVRALGMLGAARFVAGHLTEARPVLEEAVALAEAIRSSLLGGWYANLAACRFGLGNHQGAREAWRRALDRHRANGDAPAVARVLYNLAWAELTLGHLQEAVIGLDEAADQLRDGGSPGGAAWARVTSGAARLAAGHDDAREVCAAAASGDATARVKVVYAAVCARLGDPIEAAHVLDGVANDLSDALDAGAAEVAELRAAMAGGPLPARLSQTPSGRASEVWTVLGLVWGG